MLTKILSNPYYQSGIGLALLVPVLLITKMILGDSAAEGSTLIYWELSFSILLGYIMFNSILSLRTKNGMIYYRDSIFSFAILGGIGGGLAYLLSGLSLDEAATFKWLTIVFTFTYLVFLTITSLMRKFMEFAKRQGNQMTNQ